MVLENPLYQGISGFKVDNSPLTPLTNEITASQN